MLAVHPPVLFNPKQCIEIEYQVVGRHHPTGEKMATHPVVIAIRFKGIGVLAVGKDMNEDPTVAFQPGIDTRKKCFPVAHVFKHFH